MTTAKPEVRRDSEQWTPYPHLPPEPKDMEQMPPIDDLTEKLRSILTPGDQYPYHPTILIGGQIPIYYGAANPVTNQTPYVIPDCLIALNVDSAAIRRRVGYDPIQNGKPPDLVIEVASRTTHRNDTGHKRDVYRQLGVPEYWRFDPTGGSFYGQAIIGEGLVNGEYAQFPVIEYPDGSAGSTSAVLNLNFRWREWRFRIHNPATGEEYEGNGAEIARFREQAERASEQNARLNDELTRLQAENRRLRGGEPPA